MRTLEPKFSPGPYNQINASAFIFFLFYPAIYRTPFLQNIWRYSNCTFHCIDSVNQQSILFHHHIDKFRMSTSMDAFNCHSNFPCLSNQPRACPFASIKSSCHPESCSQSNAKPNHDFNSLLPLCFFHVSLCTPAQSLISPYTCNLIHPAEGSPRGFGGLVPQRVWAEPMTTSNVESQR